MHEHQGDVVAQNGLLTDLYQLVMLQGYLREGMTGPATFEFFVRKMPENRNFLVAAGLEQVLGFLEALRFTEDDIGWLAGTGRFSPDLLDYLADFRFEGDVHAMPEGTLFFPDEPILRVTAPLPQAQLVESRIINLLHYQTLIASKAARMVLAAPGKQLVDFGFRRAHGAEAGLLAARAAYLAGFNGTATVLAERIFGVPAYGTVAHSFIQAHDSEAEAFVNFARSQPENAVLLVDTYDTLEAVREVVRLAPTLRQEGIAIRGVRLDSGDLGALARGARAILDDGGLKDVLIFASSSIDEYVLAGLSAKDAPIDGFGIGTHLTTSADAPYLDCAYKLQEYAGIARRKRSTGKATWPGRKQVYREYGAAGRAVRDTVTVEGDTLEGEPLVREAMRRGKRIANGESLEEARARTVADYGTLPDALRDLKQSVAYSVSIAPALRKLAEEVDRRTTRS